MLVNLYTVADVEKWKTIENNVYIGRKTASFAESKWANPHRISRSINREQAVSKFLQDILGKKELLLDLHELKGANLGCWCVPKLCHGHILLKLLDEITSGKELHSVSTMSGHDHGTRLSTGSLSSKGQNTKGPPTPKAATSNKLTIADLCSKIDQQNTLIQQLLKESKENKDTIAKLQTEAEESKKTISSLQASIELLSKNPPCTEDSGECKTFIEALQTRTIELEAEKANMMETITTFEERIQKLQSRTIDLESGKINMAETIATFEERIQKLLDDSVLPAADRKKMADMEADFQSLSKNYEEKLLAMSNRIGRLETAKIYTDSILLIKDKVHELLSKRINHLEQYTRRYSVIVKGIEWRANEVRDGKLQEDVEGLIDQCESSTTMADVDKYHRNGPRKENKQDLIIRFKSHSAKENFYKARKTIQRRGVKVQPSLSSETKELLEEARETILHYGEDYMQNPPAFVMADVHGNLWVKFTAETKDDRLFYKFDSIEKLRGIIEFHNTDAVVMAGEDEYFNRFD